MHDWYYDHITQSQSMSIDERALFESIRQLVTSKEMRLAFGRESRERAVTEFSSNRVARDYRELWGDLSLTTDRSPRRRPPIPYDQPQYTHCFSHFASRRLDDADIISLIAPFPDINVFTLKVQRERENTPEIDASLLDQMGKTLHAIGPNTALRIATLLDDAVTRGRTRGAARRHIMLLVRVNTTSI
jgi:hypothetical protein